MKAIFALLLFCSFTAANFQQTTLDKPATVAPVQGMYIYYIAAPAGKYTVLGELKVKQQWTGEPQEQVKTALKTALEQYPTAIGIS